MDAQEASQNLQSFSDFTLKSTRCMQKRPMHSMVKSATLDQAPS